MDMNRDIDTDGHGHGPGPRHKDGHGHLHGHGHWYIWNENCWNCGGELMILNVVFVFYIAFPVLVHTVHFAIYKVGQSIVDWNVFFQFIGLHVLLKLMVALKSTGWCVFVGLLAVHLFNSDFIFLSYGLPAVVEWVLWMSSAANWSHSAAMDWHKESRLEWGIAWDFLCKMIYCRYEVQHPAGPSTANMVANPLESRIPPRLLSGPSSVDRR